MTAEAYSPLDVCVCGTPTDPDVEGWQVDAIHWQTPHSAVPVAASCSEKCGDLIEAARNDKGVLTRSAVRAVRKGMQR